MRFSRGLRQDRSIGSFLLFCIGVFLFILLILLLNYSSISKYNTMEINKNVTIKINDGAEKVVTLNKYIFPVTNKGDVVEISYILPDVEMTRPVFEFESYHSVVEVSLDDEIIYEYGQDLAESNKVLGHEYFRIDLPEDFSNKQLKVKFTYTENNAASSIDGLQISNVKDSYSVDILKNLLVLTVTSCLLVLGVIGLISSVTFLSFYTDAKELVHISIFSICVALWLLSNQSIFIVSVGNFEMTSILEYYSLYFASIPGLSFFIDSIDLEKPNSILRKLRIITVLVLAVVIILDVTGIVHYVNFVSLFQVIIVTSFIVVFVSVYLSYMHNKDGDKVLMYGMVLICVMLLLEVGRFNICKYVKNLNVFRVSLVPFGTLLFVLTITYSFCKDISRRSYDRAEKTSLRHLAYSDVLTGIPNRTKCEMILEKANREGMGCYIVNFDLNNLKEANDNYGHAIGDHMIISFSDMLMSSFGKKGQVGRMGGDEFIAIIFDCEEAVVLGCT